MLHFANDTYFYDEKSSIKEIDKFGNKNLIPLLSWLNPKWLFLNGTETEVVFFKRKSIALDTELKLKFSGKKTFASKIFKCLGIYNDEHPDWLAHAHKLNVKLFTTNIMLCKIMYCVNKTKIMFIYAFIFIYFGIFHPYIS